MDFVQPVSEAPLLYTQGGGADPPCKQRMGAAPYVDAAIAFISML